MNNKFLLADVAVLITAAEDADVTMTAAAAGVMVAAGSGGSLF